MFLIIIHMVPSNENDVSPFIFYGIFEYYNIFWMYSNICMVYIFWPAEFVKVDSRLSN